MINAVASQTTTAPAVANATGGSGTSVDHEAFLQLFIAEMQNQDPTNPTDSKDYLAQLATFSSVEQSIQTNKPRSFLNATAE